MDLAKIWLQSEFLIFNLCQVVLKHYKSSKGRNRHFSTFFKGMTLHLLSWLYQEREWNFSLVDMALFSKGQVVLEASTLHFAPWEGWGCVPDLTILYIHMHTIKFFFFSIGFFTQHSRERSISSSEKYDCENVNYQQPTDTAFCLPKLIVTQFYMATDIVHFIQHRIFIQISTASLAVSLSNLNRKKKIGELFLTPRKQEKSICLLMKILLSYFYNCFQK